MQRPMVAGDTSRVYFNRCAHPSSLTGSQRAGNLPLFLPQETRCFFSGLHSHQGQVGRMGLCKSKFVQGGFFRQNLQLPFFMTSIHFSDIGITYYIYKDGRIHLFLGAKQDFLWQLTPCAFLVPSITQFLETETWIFSSAYNLKMQREVQRIYRTEGWHLGYVDILFLSLRWLNT